MQGRNRLLKPSRCALALAKLLHCTAETIFGAGPVKGTLLAGCQLEGLAIGFNGFDKRRAVSKSLAQGSKTLRHIDPIAPRKFLRTPALSERRRGSKITCCRPILEVGQRNAGAPDAARRFGQFAILEPRLERRARSLIDLDCARQRCPRPSASSTLSSTTGVGHGRDASTRQ
jgi:hypothetical protein